MDLIPLFGWSARQAVARSRCQHASGWQPCPERGSLTVAAVLCSDDAATCHTQFSALVAHGKVRRAVLVCEDWWGGYRVLLQRPDPDATPELLRIAAAASKNLP